MQLLKKKKEWVSLHKTVSKRKPVMGTSGQCHCGGWNKERSGKGVYFSPPPKKKIALI